MSLHTPLREGQPVVDTHASPAPAGRAAPAHHRRSSILLFLAPAATAFAVIWHQIGERQLWRDEHATWWAATLSFDDLGSLIKSIDVVFTPYYVLMHLWVSVAGDSAAAMRLPGALAMASAAGLLALLGRRMFTSQAGLLAGLTFAVVPTVTRYGQEIRPYAFAVAAVLLSTLLLLRALEQPTFKGWVAYTFSVPLIGWNHLASLAVLGAHVMLVLQTRRGGDRIVGWAYSAAGILGLCFVVPMAASGAGQSGQIAWNNPGMTELLQFPKDLFGTWQTAAPIMALGLVGLCCAGRHAPALALWIALPPVATFVTAAQLHLFLPRYLLFTAPAWVLLAAVAVCRFAGPVARRRRSPAMPRRTLGWILVAASVAGLAWQALPGIRAAHGPIAGEPDFRAAAQIIEKGRQPRDGIVFAGKLSERRAMAYELRDTPHRPADVLAYRTPQQQGSYDAVECPHPGECLADTTRLWLVSTSPAGKPFDGMPAPSATVLTTQFRIVRTDQRDGVRVLLLQRTKKNTTSLENDAASRKVHL